VVAQVGLRPLYSYFPIRTTMSLDQLKKGLFVSTCHYASRDQGWGRYIFLLISFMKSSSARVSIILGETHPVVIEGLKAFFATKSIQVVELIENLEQLQGALERNPDAIIVSETKLNGQDMFDAFAAMEPRRKPLPVVFFAHSNDPVCLARALAISASDYVHKSEGLDILEAAIKRAARNERPDNSRPIYQRRIQLIAARPELDESFPLTLREMQVLRHVAMGLSNREIGRSLGISVETTKEHVQNILRKLDVNDRTQAAIWAYRHQLL
jgi:DNA-binding NarL/FixJ family response regulator